MTRVLCILLFVVSCGRAERICEAHISGACINFGGYQIEPEYLEFAVDRTFAEYSTMYGVEFSPEVLAREIDLYVRFVPLAEISGYCGEGALGCYVLDYDEIYIGYTEVADQVEGTLSKHGRYRLFPLQALGHELMHTWNNHRLRWVRPAIFGADFVETEESHSAPGMFELWGAAHPQRPTVEHEMKVGLYKFVAYNEGSES